MTKTDDRKDPQVGTIFEFTKEGTIRITEETDGKMEIYGGSYKVAGDKILVTLELPGMNEEKDPVTIKKISESGLVVEGRNGRKAEFKRLK